MMIQLFATSSAWSNFLMQFTPHYWKFQRPIFDRFAVLLSVGLVWAYAALLTVAGAYRNSPPQTQFSCRVDRSGLISGASWQVLTCVVFFYITCITSYLGVYAKQDKISVSMAMGYSHCASWRSFCYVGCCICFNC